MSNRISSLNNIQSIEVITSICCILCLKILNKSSSNMQFPRVQWAARAIWSIVTMCLVTLALRSLALCALRGSVHKTHPSFLPSCNQTFSTCSLVQRTMRETPCRAAERWKSQVLWNPLCWRILLLSDAPSLIREVNIVKPPRNWWFKSVLSRVFIESSFQEISMRWEVIRGMSTFVSATRNTKRVRSPGITAADQLQRRRK